MKLKIWLILITLLIIPNTNAIGKVYTISFTEDITQQILTIGEDDRVDFDLVNGSHTIIIDKITKYQIELDIFRYINLEPEERMPVGYVFIHPGEYAKLDLNMDKYNDLEIKMLNLKDTETTLLFTKKHECVFSDPELCKKQEEENSNEEEDGFITGLITKINSIKNIDKTGILITLSIIIIGIILFLFLKKSKS